MPAMVPTPWIEGPPPAAATFLQGYGQGAQVGEANARIAQAQAALAAQQQQHTAEIEMRKQQIAQNTRLELQKAEIAKAYHEAQIGMAQQRLQQAKAMDQLKWMQSAHKFAASQEYERGLQAIDTDTTMTDAQKKAAKVSLIMQYGPAMSGGSVAGLGAVMKAGEPATQRVSPLETSNITSLQGQIAKMEESANIPGIKPKAKAELLKVIDEKKRSVNERRAQYGLGPAYPVPEAPQPMPKRIPEDLVVGRTYYSERYGLATYDGKRMIPVQR